MKHDVQARFVFRWHRVRYSSCGANLQVANRGAPTVGSKMIRLCTLTVLCTLAAMIVPAASAANPGDSKPFTSKEGRFTINFPGRPDETTSTQKSPQGDLALHVFKVAREN